MKQPNLSERIQSALRRVTKQVLTLALALSVVWVPAQARAALIEVQGQQFSVISRGENRVVVPLTLVLQSFTRLTCQTEKAFLYLAPSTATESLWQEVVQKIAISEKVRPENVIRHTEFRLLSNPRVVCEPGVRCVAAEGASAEALGVSVTSYPIYGQRIEGFEIKKRETLCDLISRRAGFQFSENVAVRALGSERFSISAPTAREILDRVLQNIDMNQSPLERAALLGARLYPEIHDVIQTVQPETIRVFVRMGFDSNGTPRLPSDREVMVQRELEDQFQFSGIWKASYTGVNPAVAL